MWEKTHYANVIITNRFLNCVRMKQIKYINELKKLSLEELVDLLSTQTSLLIQMHARGASDEEFEKCKSLIQLVQQEIKSRKKINNH